MSAGRPQLKLGVCIPVCAGREENLDAVLEAIKPFNLQTVVVDDGGDLNRRLSGPGDPRLIRVAKHHPGMEQPRNIGVRHLKQLGCTHVWFLDSDVMPSAQRNISLDILDAIARDPHRILVCPYDWLSPGMRDMNDPAVYAERNDPRWEMFGNSPPERIYINDLSAGLACFSGNLVWPIEEFIHVGGFWSEIHHGRCEDGELGLRAVAMEIPISLIAQARGFHLFHPVNTVLAVERNARDVPMLNERHPWVERGAVFLSDRDGGAFDVKCDCGQVIPTIGWWAHAAMCSHTGLEIPVGPITD